MVYVCRPTPPQESKHFEDAFQAYERGVALFKYPHSKDIWVAYLAKFVARYGGRKLERARDLFRHALREVGFGFRVWVRVL
jgi:pre-mRNA-splicing factor SYF1